MSRNLITVAVFTILMGAGTFVLAGPEGTVRGADRDRVAVIAVQDFNLKAFEGKVVLIGFWRGADCLSCPDYLEWMSEMQDMYGPKGLITVAVDQDGDQSTGGDLLPIIDPRTQVVIDPTGKMGSAYQIEAIPSTYLYDRNQNLVYTFVDFDADSPEPMEIAIKDLLKKKYKH